MHKGVNKVFNLTKNLEIPSTPKLRVKFNEGIQAKDSEN